MQFSISGAALIFICSIQSARAGSVGDKSFIATTIASHKFSSVSSQKIVKFALKHCRSETFEILSLDEIRLETNQLQRSSNGISNSDDSECRSECLESNKYKIVRVHLSEDFVRAGACRNVTTVGAADVQTTPKSQVFPFICDRRIGIWETDEQDEEGIVDFNIQCPHVEEVQPEVLKSCPKK